MCLVFFSYKEESNNEEEEEEGGERAGLMEGEQPVEEDNREKIERVSHWKVFRSLSLNVVLNLYLDSSDQDW